MAKVNIYIPDEMLEQIDVSASAAGRSRSSVVQEAVGEYFSAARDQVAESLRRTRVGRAIAEMEAIRERAAANDTSPGADLSDFLIELRDSQRSLTNDEIIARIRARGATRSDTP